MSRFTSAQAMLFQCRAGFEHDLAQELAALCQRHEIVGRTTFEANAGYIVLHFDDVIDWGDAQKTLSSARLCFARQAWPVVGHVDALPERDRVTPIVDQLARGRTAVADVCLEYPDTNSGKTRSGFCKRFEAPLRAGLEAAGLLKPALRKAPTLYLFFPDAESVWLGLCEPRHASPWPMGIARLRMPREAPSRSTLKLAEAFLALLDHEERDRWLRAGGKAVDLGAAPGGWSWQLAQHGLRVTAIDNGPMDPALLAEGMVTHVRADGFVWRPKGSVDWLVCDMVEQPTRIATLMADWFLQKKCRHAIFNLKLPMKKRHAALRQCIDIIRSRLKGIPITLRFAHLYHDREEVTGYLCRQDTR
ncbi:23S rRNA (cytidine(2498)-2'-O)-methyltransferase RlmM [Nitrogeniibacter mangrovi]|uniref:23S rRNA (Cytidine(2498)-2'-O)-methyltransferase RlmM n=1 Tax=Nitrogeniibacter mangrovi TaxID=2016596 RepID=A0A6C1B8N8_9RHOO|nr:23S rRNA (cytidine(2498)-2'-O)-methyltransferase RlmM [Nitrogeniibacter mangrovi]QID18710.1 23S rRNA (cytidine(2498)-2'-O)-methyltransferase RlmM [Nitrogeniibacter mangrovi]